MLSKFWTHFKIKDLWLLFSVIRQYVTITFFPPVCGRCLKQPLWWAFWFFWNAHPPPPHIILFFPIILGGYHGIKEKKAWHAFSLTVGFFWYHANTHTALHHVDPYSNKSHVLELSFHLMRWKICQYSFCLVPGLQSSIIGGLLRALMRKSSVYCGWS